MSDEVIPIFTIGYGARSMEEFTAVLQHHQIEYLIDIRSAPYSRHKPEFSKEALNASLHEVGVRYLFMGNTLGGRPVDPDCYTDGVVDYGKVQQKEFYQEGVGRVQKAFEQQQRIALMCSEQKPEHCHRTLLVGDSLSQLEIPLAHIDENGEILEQTAVLDRLANGESPNEFSQLESFQLDPNQPPPPLFEDFLFPDEAELNEADEASQLANLHKYSDPISNLPALPKLDSPQHALKTIFGYGRFRPLQQEIIDNVMQWQDSLVVMPTGGGKSICFQIPALLFDGLTVVVSPLISLMQDQVSQLQGVGVTAVFLNSSLAHEARDMVIQQIRAGQVKLLYVAPETLLKPETMRLLEESNLSCLAIDEAHCISQWGHDFRPEYRQIASVRQRLPNAVTIALTATATPRVQQDIKETLNFSDSNTFIASFDRPNLFIEVASKTDTLRQVLNFIAAHPDQSGIIYCATRKTVDALYGELSDRGLSVRAYHAGLDARTRSRNQNDFIRDDVQIMVATVAFGMGIDKPDVRFVLHTDLPQNMEHYYQQIGRAGRDGLRSDCFLLFGYHDVATIRYFIEQGAESEQRGREQRLQVMVSWAETAVCRRDQLLSYFGETHTKENCGICDNCTQPKKEKQDITMPAQKFLSCVYRTKELFGMSHIIDVLRGSQSQKVLQKGHQHLSTYGIGTEFSKRDWQFLARQFIRQKMLVQDAQFGSLKLTEEGWAVLKGEEKAWGQLHEIDQSQILAETAVYNPALFHLLRAKRKELADENDVPPYIIFSDRSLQEMATYFPHSAKMFSQMHGIGQRKVEQFSDIFLPLIVDFCQENDLQEKPKITSTRRRTNRITIGKSRADEVGEAFLAGKSVEDLTAVYKVKRSTVISNLTKFYQAGNTLPPEQLRASSTLPEERQIAVLNTFAELGTEYLRPIFDAFNGQVFYDELHLMRLIFRLEMGEE